MYIENEFVNDISNSFIYLFTGKSFLHDPGIVCFQNMLHRSWGDWNVADMENISSYPNRRDLRHHKMSSLNFVSHLTLRITSTLGGSAVCLRKLEIWGQPSFSTPKSLICKIKELISRQNPSKSETVKHVKLKSETEVPDRNESLYEAIKENGVDIPQDFLDKITCEIITLPMLLPSGESIDQSTLEKHIAAEATWGRPPGDPFTGIAFHGNHQAVTNVHLKTRIDKFLLANSEALSHLPRTLGRKKDDAISGPSASRLVDMTKIAKVSKSLTPHTKGQVPVDQLNSENKSSTNKRHRDHTRLIETHSKRMKIDTRVIELDTPDNVSNCPVKNLHSHESEFENSSCRSVKSNLLISNNQKVILSHDVSLKSSLDTALASTLGSLPSFTNFSAKQSESNKGGNSPSCSTRVGNSAGATQGGQETKCRYCDRSNCVLLYKGGCSHVVCRECLTKRTLRHIKCDVCGYVSNRNEMTKIHVNK